MSEELVREARQLEAGAKGGMDLTAREKRLVRRYRVWQMAIEQLTLERVAWGETIAKARARLREAVEQGVGAHDAAAAAAKCHAIEQAWQAVEEEKAGRKEAIKTAREAVEIAEAKFREMIESTKQLALFDSSAGSD